MQRTGIFPNYKQIQNKLGCTAPWVGCGILDVFYKYHGCSAPIGLNMNHMILLCGKAKSMVIFFKNLTFIIETLVTNQVPLNQSYLYYNWSEKPLR